MTTRLHVGRSTAADVRAAAAESVTAALRDADHPAIALVFSTDPYDPAALAVELSEQLGQLPWAGCTAASVLCQGELLDRGVVVAVLSSPEASVGIGVSGPISHGARAAGASAVARALDQLPSFDPTRGRLALLFTASHGGHADEVVRGAVAEGGTAIDWLGAGTAGDGPRRAGQYARGQAFSEHAVAAVVDLPRRAGCALRHGWTPWSLPATVTRAQSGVASELEYEPAFELFRRAAARAGTELTQDAFPAFAALHPLGIPRADGRYLIRDPLGLVPGGGVRCVAEIPEGSLVRLMHSEPAALIEAARQAASAARAAAGEPLGGALVLDCVSRFAILGPRGSEELGAMSLALGPGVPLVGALTFGEIGALGAGPAQFHNKTAAVLALPA